MEKKLIAIDIDGTLVNDQKQIMPETKYQIQRLAKEGHKIVLCSGRSISGLKDYLNELDLWGKEGEYAITFNGGNVFDLGTMKSIDAKYLTAEQAIKADKLAHKLGVGDTLVAASQKSYTVNNQMNEQALTDIKDSKLIPVEVTNYDFLGNEKIQKCLWTDTPETITKKVEEIPEEYFNEFQIVRSGPIFLEFLPLNSSKGNAVKDLAEQVKIDRQNVIVFGDEENDLSMFNFAGTAVAMRNARDEIKQYADRLSAADNNHDGVGMTLKEIFD